MSWLGLVDRRLSPYRLAGRPQGLAFGVPPWPFGPRNQQLPTVPWHDLRQIVFWDHLPRGSFIRQAYLGLALRPGVAPPPALAGSRIRLPRIPVPKRLRESSTWPPPHVPPDIISVPIVDWRLDRARLLQLVTAYAPTSTSSRTSRMARCEQ
jgi:hypothetical protein